MTTLSNNIATILADSERSLVNPKFANSKFKTWSQAANVTKGKIGEDITSAILEDLGYNVDQRETPEHDRVVDGKRVEMKTAFLKRNEDRFTFYGVKATDDAHYWTLLMVEPEQLTLIALDRTQFGNIYFRESKDGIMFTASRDEIMKAGTALYQGKA